MHKNSRQRVIVLISICFLLYLFFSICSLALNIKWQPFDNINLVADIFKSPKAASVTHKIQRDGSASQSQELDFELYKKPQLITNFHRGDTNSIYALTNFNEKLYELKKSKKGKIRIGYFGDSMIENDLLTQTLRKLLQNEFGGYGVGYLPIYSKVSSLRTTATIKSQDWNVVNFLDKHAKNMYISGYSFNGLGTGSFKDNTVQGSSKKLQKLLIYGKSDESEIEVNDSRISLAGYDNVNIKMLSDDDSTSFRIKSNSPDATLFGVSFESDNGIILDNFSFRGITGVEFKKIDEDFLREIQEKVHYDLVVFQYGVNLLFRPNDTDYSYYVKNISPVLSKFKKAFPNTDILLVSCADRAFRYNGEYKTAKGLPNLLEAQAQLAFDNKLAFFNLYATMGGENSIVEWASKEPSLANKDYLHPNTRGAKILAERLYKALMKDFRNYKYSKNKDK